MYTVQEAKPTNQQKAALPQTQTPIASAKEYHCKHHKNCHNHKAHKSTRIIMMTTIITVPSIKTTSATNIKASIMTSIKTSTTKTMTTCFSTCSFARVSSNTSGPELVSLTLIESLLHLIVKTFHHLILKETLEAAAGIPSTV